MKNQVFLQKRYALNQKCVLLTIFCGGDLKEAIKSSNFSLNNSTDGDPCI